MFHRYIFEWAKIFHFYKNEWQCLNHASWTHDGLLLLNQCRHTRTNANILLRRFWIFTLRQTNGYILRLRHWLNLIPTLCQHFYQLGSQMPWVKIKKRPSSLRTRYSLIFILHNNSPLLTCLTLSFLKSNLEYVNQCSYTYTSQFSRYVH